MQQPHRWGVRVSPHGEGQVRVFVRQHQFDVGAPLQFDQKYDRVTALEYALGALGGELVEGFRILAKKKRAVVDNIEAKVEGELNNALTYLGVVGEEGHPGLEWIKVRLYVSTLETEETIRAVWDELASRSPLVRTLGSCVKLELSFQID